MKDDALDEMLDTAMNATGKLLQQRNSPPYDGVLGQLPGWVQPDSHKAKFLATRNKLLDKGIGRQQIRVKVIIRWMDDCDRLANGKQPHGVIPPDVRSDVGYLAFIRYAISLGPEDGLRVLAGEKAVKGGRFSKGGGTKKGKEYEPKKSIRAVCNEINSFEFDKVIDALRDADFCADLYESTTTPIDVQIDEVNDTVKVICYRRRGRPATQTKRLKFGTLRNILTAIKNNP